MARSSSPRSRSACASLPRKTGLAGIGGDQRLQVGQRGVGLAGQLLGVGALEALEQLDLAARVGAVRPGGGAGGPRGRGGGGAAGAAPAT